MYKIFETIAQVINQLYLFVQAVIFYPVNLFGHEFELYQIFGYLVGAGLTIFITIKIIKVFI